MEFPKTLICLWLLSIAILFSFKCKAQTVIDSGEEQIKSGLYLNAGYLTNLSSGCEDCDKQTGGSLRAGYSTQRKWGFHIGYVWYNVELVDVVDYEDKGAALVLGVDFRLVNNLNFRWYLLFGLAFDSYTSTYPSTGREDVENSTSTLR